jgi:HEPN domain-containing protein
MSTEQLIASYLRIANQDLKDALLLEANQSPNAIYHCEQAAEKIILAVLTSEGLRAGYAEQHQLRGQDPR